MRYKKIILFTIIFVILVIFNTTKVNGETGVDRIMAEIEALKEKIFQLQNQLFNIEKQGKYEGSLKSEGLLIVDSLKYGDTGKQVEILQKMLSKDSSIYPEKIVSGFFGYLTKQAVIRFQEKYKGEVLAPFGLNYGNGFVGSLTRKKLNALYAGQALIDGNVLVQKGWPVNLPIDTKVGDIYYDMYRRFEVADITGDGKKEVLVIDDSARLVAYDFAGTLLWDFYPPVLENTNGTFVRYLAVGDLNDDGKNYIILSTVSYIASGDFNWESGGKIYVLDGEKNIVDSWEAELPSYGISIGDVDQEHAGKEIIVVGHQNIYLFSNNGDLLDGWPKSVDQSILGKISAIADINGDNNKDIIYTGMDSNDYFLKVFDNKGELICKWVSPRISGFYNLMGKSPVAGDLDRDGKIEIAAVFGGDVGNHKLYVWNSNCFIKNGWPRDLSSATYGSPALADINWDGDMEILVSDKYYYYSFNPDGTTDWMVNRSEINSNIYILDVGISPIAGDFLDKEGLEVVFGNVMIDSEGNPVIGWNPVESEGHHMIDGLHASVAADLDGDGDIEIIRVSTKDHYVRAWDIDSSSKEIPWPAFQHDAMHIGYGVVLPINRPPFLSTIGNKVVYEKELLSFNVNAYDPNNDNLIYSADNIPKGANFDPKTRIFSWQPDKGQEGVYENVHFEVSDGELTDSEDITITVKNLMACQNNKDCNVVGSFCELPSCFAESGACIKMPVSCGYNDMADKPVCGCDGRTYNNDCERKKTGVSKDYDGKCKEKIAYFEFKDNKDDVFVFKLNNLDLIEEARDILSGKIKDKSHVMGNIIKKKEPYNPLWSYILDPITIKFFENSVEVCDAGIQYVEDYLSEACGSFLPNCQWCPWSSKLVQELEICSDNTPVGFCSLSKPKYCQKMPDASQSLVNKCKECGCPEGSICQTDGSCKREEVTCADTDGGKDYYVKGKCSCNNSAIIYQDYCTADNKSLFEYYCSTGPACSIIFYQCPYGCKDGVCLKENYCQSNNDCSSNQFCQFSFCTINQGECVQKTEVCTTEYDPVCGCDGRTYNNDCERKKAGVSKDYDGKCKASSCNDTDGGENYYVKGTVTYGGGEATDFCQSSLDYKGLLEYILTEYYCNSDNSLGEKRYTCLDGCINGACTSREPDPIGLEEIEKQLANISESARQLLERIKELLKQN